MNTPKATDPKKAGRPPLPPEQRLSVVVQFRCSPAQREKLAQMGDWAAWLRWQIDKAKAPKG